MPSQRTDLKIFCWEGYDSASILDPFRSRHAINVETESLISDSLAAQRVSSPSLETEFDVLNINNAWVQKHLYPNGIVRPLDKNRFAYEYYKIKTKSVPSEFSMKGGRHANKKEMLGLYNHLEDALDEAGFFHVSEKRPNMVRNLRNLIQRSNPTEQEVRTLRGVINSLRGHQTDNS